MSGLFLNDFCSTYHTTPVLWALHAPNTALLSEVTSLGACGTSTGWHANEKGNVGDNTSTGTHSRNKKD